MASADWLIARPVAHRGLHDSAAGVIENTPLAFAGAVAGNYAIECDLQLAADGEAMVFHDDTLDRLTEGSGRVDALAAAALKRVTFRATSDHMITLGELCELVAGRVTLVIEVKSHFDGDRRLIRRAAEVLAGYRGPVAVMSFDPECIATFRRIEPFLPRGLISERFEDTDHWRELTAGQRFTMRHLLTAVIARPNFIAYDIRALPALAPGIARDVFHLPLLTWTVRTDNDKAAAQLFADAMIFEGTEP